MLNIFIGWDSTETIAYHVLSHSLLTRSSLPLAITPVGNELLPEFMWHRKRSKTDSTEFSNARFLVPSLMDYQGWAVFMDCDMLCSADIQELVAQADPRYAVMVRKHQHLVNKGEKKFLGRDQYAYSRKNWSSLMLINCAHPAWLEIDPNEDDGLFLHQFEFLQDDEIGEIQDRWNTLLVPGEHNGAQISKLWHFTLGGPWHGWCKYNAAWAWCREFSDMLRGNNPRAHIEASLADDGVTVGGSYHVSSADAKAEAEAEAETQKIA